jgi:hypothetical protein
VTKRPVTNIAASVYDRLRNKARETNRPFDEWLRYFGMERFLYRLSQTPHADRFVLKGALMFKVWHVDVPRPTLDIDLLGMRDVIDQVDVIVRDICRSRVEPEDGLVFDPDSVKTGPIAEQGDFEGVRAAFRGKLVNARIPMQIDVGFGTVSPEPVKVDLPAILDFPPPRLRGYTRESTIAEKFDAMVKHDILNSRMKDFFDIWILSRRFEFDGASVARAVVETFAERKSAVPAEPMALTDAFAENPMKITQWRAFLRKQQLGQYAPESLKEVIAGIASFLGPIAVALAGGKPFKMKWPAGGPWN